MRITIDDLTVGFRHLDREELLADWRWLVDASKHVILVTAAGDAFLQDETSGSVWALDVDAGEVWHVADDVDTFKGLLTNQTFVRDQLAVDLVAGLRERGLTLGPGQVYSLKQPLVLGGELTSENFEACDMSVHFSLAGQIHERVRDLPESTNVAT